MKTTTCILIIEDPYGFNNLANICRQGGGKVSVQATATFDEAVQTLRSDTIDVTIIDISSGYGLQSEDLQRLAYKFPSVPCIVLTRKEQKLDDALSDLGIAACLTVPISSVELEAGIRSVLNESARGKIQGLPLYSLLQIFESDRISCSLKVSKPTASGHVYIDQGTPVAAESGDLLHEEALSSMLIWDGVSVEIGYYNGQRPRGIEKPLLPIIMDAFRLKDEKAGPGVKKGPIPLRPGFFSQHSREGSRLALEAGTPVTVEHRDSEATMVCTVAGTVANHSLILLPPDLPRPSDRRWRGGSLFTVKYLYMGELCSFKSELIKEIESPCHLLFLNYPKTVQVHEMRGAPRVTTVVPAVLEYQNGFELPGTINDLSHLGCLFGSRITKSTPLPVFDIGYHVRLRCGLPGIHGVRLLPAVIRNLRKSATALHLGLRFTDLPGQLRRLIDGYTLSTRARKDLFGAETG